MIKELVTNYVKERFKPNSFTQEQLTKLIKEVEAVIKYKLEDSLLDEITDEILEEEFNLDPEDIEN